MAPAPQADLSTQAITGLLRYKLNENFSVHAGLRGLSVDGYVVSTPGVLTASNDRDWGYVSGVAYERPDIAMRIAVSYNSEIDNNLSGTTPLAPTNGSDTIGLAATYTEGNMKLTAGVSYGKLGDQDVSVYEYRDASVVGFGLRLGYNF